MPLCTKSCALSSEQMGSLSVHSCFIPHFPIRHCTNSIPDQTTISLIHQYQRAQHAPAKHKKRPGKAGDTIVDEDYRLKGGRVVVSSRENFESLMSDVCAKAAVVAVWAWRRLKVDYAKMRRILDARRDVLGAMGSYVQMQSEG